MAIDYGYWTALSKGFQTSQDRKRQRQNDEMKEMQMMQMLQQQQSQKLQQQQTMQQQIDMASALTDQLLKSSFGRQKDIDDMKKWHAEESGWGDIKNIIQQYNGDYGQARLYGNLDYYMNQYKHKINNPNIDPTQGNPILARVQKNKASLEKLILAKSTPEDAKKIMPGDLERYNSWLNGEVDEFIFAGLRGEYDMDSLIAETTMGEEIGIDNYIAANFMSIVSDMSRDTGLTPDIITENPNLIKEWVGKATGFNNEMQVYGTKEVDTSYVVEFTKNLDALPASLAQKTGKLELTLNDVYSMDEEGVSFQMLLEGRDEDGKAYSDVWEQLGGYNSQKTSHSKLGGTNVWEGHQLISSGQILTDEMLQIGVLTSMYGGNYDAERREVNNIQMLGLYEEGGTMITDDDVSGTWWERGLETAATGAVGGAAGGAVVGGVGAVPGAIGGAVVGGISGVLGWNPWGEEEEMDLKYNGTFLAFRVRGLDSRTGQPTTALITRGTDKSDIEKIKKEYGNWKVEAVMVNELIDSDTLSSDDVYYDIIDTNKMSFRQAMDENTNSESLSNVYNESLSYETKKKNEAAFLKKEAYLNQRMADIYTDGNTEILPEVAESYKKQVSSSLIVGGVTAETAVTTTPMVMSWLLTESEKASKGPEGEQLLNALVQKGEISSSEIEEMSDTQKQNIIMEHMATTLVSGLGTPQYAQMKEALQQGPKAFLNWYSKNTDKETFKNFSKKNKDWAKYFRIKK